jgi:3,4-dihydroxy-2-butanone 4-phosphate synthase
VEQMALTIRHGSGIVCLCLTEERRKQLDLPMMVENNTSQHQTAPLKTQNQFMAHRRDSFKHRSVQDCEHSRGSL